MDEQVDKFWAHHVDDEGHNEQYGSLEEAIAAAKEKSDGFAYDRNEIVIMEAVAFCGRTMPKFKYTIIGEPKPVRAKAKRRSVPK